MQFANIEDEAVLFRVPGKMARETVEKMSTVLLAKEEKTNARSNYDPHDPGGGRPVYFPGF